MRSPSGRHLVRLVDWAIPWGVGAFLVLVTVDESTDSSRWQLVASIGLAIVQAAALYWRRSRPERTMAIVLLAGLGFHVLVPEIVLPIAGFFAVRSLAALRPPAVSLVGLAGLLALSAANFLTSTAEDAVFTMGLAVGAWALGEAARNRDMAIAEEARRAVAEERARLARELHDVIAHSVSVIVVQAAAAEHVFEERPDQARAALRSIEAAGRDAQHELQRLLAAVRPGTDDDRSHPQPGLARLDELAQPLRAAGLEVDVRLEGRARPVPAGVDLSAYRIVQEALTNTLRHARAARADVVVRYQPDALELEVSDDGRADTASSAMPGFGIVGMRERAVMLGGTLEASPRAGGGFAVHARLPLEPAP